MKMARGDGPSSLPFAESKIRWLLGDRIARLHLSWDYIWTAPEPASTLWVCVCGGELGGEWRGGTEGKG